MDRNDVGGELQPDKVTTSIIIVEEQNCDNLKFHQVIYMFESTNIVKLQYPKI